MSVAELTAGVQRMVRQVGHWPAARWAAPAAKSPGHRRGDLVHQLVQEFADLAADAEGVPRRPVPRLDNDVALPDQLRVVTADLLAADPPAAVLADAAARIAAVRDAL